jgi:hypothetical protein
MPLSDREYLDRHKQSLGEAHRACQLLAKNQDPMHLMPRGRHYIDLKDALAALEGSARQLGTLRSDARWIRLGAVYGRTKLLIQPKMREQNWKYFGTLMPLFDLGVRRLAELDVKTGVLGPILPKRASEWLVMPQSGLVLPQSQVTMH